MCGRYASSANPDDLIEQFEVVDVSERVSRQPREPDFNVAPTKDVYAVLERASGDTDEVRRRLTYLRWGLVPSWAKDVAIGNKMINARAETLAEKPSYKRAFAKRRCLVPADGYYEWYATQARGKSGKPLKQPFFIRPADGGQLAMAGLYEIWRDPSVASDDDPSAFCWSMTIITTSATDDVGHVHDRMPMILTPDRYADWLDPTLTDTDEASGLLVPASTGSLQVYPVSKAVNNVRNNGRELIDPLPIEESDNPTLFDA